MTERKTVDLVRTNNICVSCGACAAVCPKRCISYNKQEDVYVPTINKEECIKCGLCFKICPSVEFDYLNAYKKAFLQTPQDFFRGNVLSCYTACCKDSEMLRCSTSGGVIVTIVKNLLQKKEYNCAFLADSFDFHKQAQTNRYEIISEYENICKSKYVFVSQENAIRYILKHREEKIILVGTPCFFHAVQNLIAIYSLNRENYLMIGLFCDKSLSYNFIEYFEEIVVKEPIEKLYFRNKETGGWPGNVQVITKGGEEREFSSRKRMEVKDYFCPERCLYCIDKLNQFSDLAVGDNYTGENLSNEGSSCIIVRTKRGLDILEKEADLFNLDEIPISIIETSQHMFKKVENYNYAILFLRKKGIKCDILSNRQYFIGIRELINYLYKMHKVKIGRAYPITKMKMLREIKMKYVIMEMSKRIRR